MAKFKYGLEPLEGFYLAVVFNGEIVLLLKDMRKKAFRKTNSTFGLYNVVFLTKKEYIFGKKLYDMKAQFRDNGQNHNLSIECDTIGVDNPFLAIHIDSKMVMQVKRLR